MQQQQAYRKLIGSLGVSATVQPKYVIGLSNNDVMYYYFDQTISNNDFRQVRWTGRLLNAFRFNSERLVESFIEQYLYSKPIEIIKVIEGNK